MFGDIPGDVRTCGRETNMRTSPYAARVAMLGAFGVPGFACTTKTMSIEGIVKDVEAYMGTVTLIHLRVILAICRPKKSLDAPLYAFGHLGSFWPLL